MDRRQKLREQEKIRKEILRKKALKEREELQAKKAMEMEERGERKKMLHPDYPEAILTMLKRLKRIDPWKGVAVLDPYNAAVVVYYKLRQNGIEPLRFKSSAKHAWVEFKYDGKWWIFDPLAVRLSSLGEPIKRSIEAKEDAYRGISRTFDTLKEFYDTFERKIHLSHDEAKVTAQGDYHLGTVIKMNYH